MARPIQTKEAKQLSSRHKTLLAQLKSAVSLADSYVSKICTAADALTEQAVLEVLSSVPVEELNRKKRGIRTKSLRDSGLCTIADLYLADCKTIADVNGISDEAAPEVKQLAQDLADAARKEVRLRLSADEKTPANTALVQAISSYKNTLPASHSCRKLVSTYGEKINAALADLRPATGSLKWLFSGKDKKDRSVLAYAYLLQTVQGDYGKQGIQALRTLESHAPATAETAWEDFSRDPVPFFTILEQLRPGLLGTGDSLYGLPETLAQDVQGETLCFDGLKCTLRRYQELGVKYILHQKRVLLGDEMGLGKTIQAIAAMVSLRNGGATHFAVVCPASVVTNWCREITKHSDLTAIKVHGTERESALARWIKEGGVAVTTYETTAHFRLEDAFRFSMLTVDEAHYIKNPEAKRTANTIAICRHADRALFMTGTALENRVDEMVSLIHILQPKIAAQIKPISFMAAAPQFREKVAPVYYRRRREDVLTELPELIESKEWCTLAGEEEALYEQAVLSDKYTDARRVSWNVEDLNHSSKACRLKELVEEAEDEGRKVIVFSFFLDTIRKLGPFLGQRCLGPITGSVPPQQRQEIIDRFHNAPAGSVLLAQIQSGGTGLNIQSASVVVICEPQFKPSIENQAIARAYRMGQSRSVLVYRLLCDDTVDEKITALLEEKQKIFDAFADPSVAAEESLSLDEAGFGTILQEERQRIQAKNTTRS